MFKTYNMGKMYVCIDHDDSQHGQTRQTINDKYLSGVPFVSE